MATAAETILIQRRGGGFTAFADRWIYVFMAALFIVTVLVGFIPDSVAKVGAVAAGQRPAFPMILHLHSALMGSWLLLLFTQALLMALGKPGLHKQLGIAGAVLAPAMVIVGFLLIPAMDGQVIDGIRHGPPPVAEQLRAILPIVLNIMAVQIRAGLVFAILVTVALATRRAAPDVHKRLMFLATLAPLPAATDRMSWLPTSIPGSALTIELWPLVILAPMFLWDLHRQKRIHRAYVIWFAVSLAPAIAMHLCWNSPAWHAVALTLLGAPDLI